MNDQKELPNHFKAYWFSVLKERLEVLVSATNAKEPDPLEVFVAIEQARGLLKKIGGQP